MKLRPAGFKWHLMRAALWMAWMAAGAAVLPALGGLPAYAQPAPAKAADSCLGCHGDKEGYKEDVHAQKGLGCTACHGGDSSLADMAAMSPAKGFRGKIRRAQIPELCGACHSDPTFMKNYAPRLRVDQLALYRTSTHGKKLAAGRLDVATCVDCHGVHDIRPVSDPRSTAFPVHQPETCGRCHLGSERKEYEQSIHWELLSKNREMSAPACATCHGSHGATPPNVSSVANVCGTCHVLLDELFLKSRHGPAFKAAGMRGCAECHGNHRVLRTSDAMLGDHSGAVCLNCHSAGDAGLKFARSLSESLTRTKEELAAADRFVRQAEVYGMEVSEARMQIGEANQALVQARVVVHGLDAATFAEQTQKGLKTAQSARAMGVAAIRERDVRRKFLLISLTAILITMVGLYFTIKTVERN